MILSARIIGHEVLTHYGNIKLAIVVVESTP